MSAFFVPKPTIDLLVSAAIDLGVYAPLRSGGWHYVTVENGGAYGVMLWGENLLSLMARYPDDPMNAHYHSDLSVYAFQPFTAVQPAAALSLARCYGQQSCEHGGWQASDAREFINRLVMALAQHVIGNAGPWGVDTEQDAAAWATPVHRSRVAARTADRILRPGPSTDDR